MKNTRAVVLLLCLPATASFAQSLTAATWNKDPRIVAVRAVVSEIETAIKAGNYRHDITEFGYEQPYRDMLRETYTDKYGRIRKIAREAGSDDSALTWNYYYDQTGRLRFVFITGGAVNETEIEHRLYFDESGARLYEFQKLIKGPGYTFPHIWPDEDLIFNPKNFSLTDN